MDTTGDAAPVGPKEIGKRVLDLRLRADLSQGDLAARTKAGGAEGVSAGYVSLVERGEVRSSFDKLNVIARALGFRDAAAMLNESPAGVEGNPSPNEANHLRVVPGGGGVGLPQAAPDGGASGTSSAPGRLVGPPVVLVRLPIVARANAGPGGGMIAERETAMVPESLVAGHDARMVLVSGDCMYPDIAAGDYVLVDAALAPRDGDIVAVRIKSTDEVVVKRYRRGDGGRVLLTPNITAQGVGKTYDLDASDAERIGVVYTKVRGVGRFDVAAETA